LRIKVEELRNQFDKARRAHEENKLDREEDLEEVCAETKRNKEINQVWKLRTMHDEANKAASEEGIQSLMASKEFKALHDQKRGYEWLKQRDMLDQLRGRFVDGEKQTSDEAEKLASAEGI
jgi:hypothetical protein